MPNKIDDLVIELNKATAAYDKGTPYMSDKEWDDLYFKLVELEKQYGYIPSDSPAHKISFDRTVSELKAITHNHKMLSLDKTKDTNDVLAFVNKQEYLAMCKMDGLTCSLCYNNGLLVSAETRGNGFVGEDILHNAIVLASIPKKIDYEGTLIIDGEIICDYKSFEDFADKYKNPRNFASGSIRLLDNRECKNRKLSFVVWDIINGYNDIPTLSNKLDIIKTLGFTTVPYVKVNDIDAAIANIKQLAIDNYYPIDGIVFKFDNIAYGKSMGETSHHFKNAIAYKFYDETYPSNLLNIEFTMGRTGILTPVAIFEPVEIDGSVVERASLHNLSIMRETLGTPYFNQDIEVGKANAIIPQIYNAVKIENPNNSISIPEACPICGQPLIIKQDYDSEFLFCNNDECAGKLVNRLDHFCGKAGLDIKGLSIKTLEKLIDLGWVNSISDVFTLKAHRNDWIKIDGFGPKSVDNILFAIEKAKECELSSFISAIGIPLIGNTASKVIAKTYDTWNDFRNAKTFVHIGGFGYEMNDAIKSFDYSEADELVKSILIIKNSLINNSNISNLQGMSIVITGKLNLFKNRDELQKIIEEHGGKVVSAVSSKTSLLINNDNTSKSAKNVSAQKLGIDIITEQEFKEKFLDLK